MSIAKLLTLVLLVAVWSVFIWWTVKKLWRPRNNQGEARHVAFVKTAGVMMTTFCAFRLPSEIPMPPFEYWQLVGYWGFIAFPIMSWSMYFAMRLISAFAGRQ